MHAVELGRERLGDLRRAVLALSAIVICQVNGSSRDRKSCNR
jgi:hypothetical protein